MRARVRTFLLFNSCRYTFVLHVHVHCCVVFLRLMLDYFILQFGKGIYFADLVSKSAQYCFTDKENPVGLMLLSEVALGEVYELKNAMVS